MLQAFAVYSTTWITFHLRTFDKRAFFGYDGGGGGKTYPGSMLYDDNAMDSIIVITVEKDCFF